MHTRITSLLLFIILTLVVPAHAGFWALSNLDIVVEKKTDVTPPLYLLKGFTFANYDIPFKDLVVGTTTGVINVNPQTYKISMVDDFELNDTFAPRNGANPPELRTTNFGGSATWQDTNGADKFDFFIFEIGGNDEFALQAILVGGALGQKVVVKASQWLATAPEPLPDLKKSGGDNNGQQIAGLAFKITDLLGEDGKPLANDTTIEGLLFTSPGVDLSCICAVVGTRAASGPKPADGAIVDNVCMLLQWSAGLNAASEKVYFSASKDDVTNLVPSALLTTATTPAAAICVPGTPYAAGLLPGTYYWRIASTDAAQVQTNSPVWSFTVISPAARDPRPVDGAIYVDSGADLSWNSGANAIIHYAVIGTDRDQVANTAQGAPVANPTFDPGTLEKGKTYFWRIDEFSGTKTTVGAIWSFSTMPAGEGGLKAEYFAGEQPLTGDPKVTRIDPQVDFDWNQTAPDASLDRLAFSARWKGEIQIPADGTYTFILRSNDGSRLYVNDQLAISDWSTHTVRDTTGTITLKAGTYPIAVEYFQQGGSAEIEVLWQSDLIARQVIPSVALIPAVRARLVYPADKAINVSQNPRLLWEAAAVGARHDAYLGEDAAAVEQATTSTTGIYKGRQDETSSVASLDTDTTYYWRIDEVIEGDPQSPIKGRIWSFTTAPFTVVEDFENYLDTEPDRIFDAWLDGWDNPANGSVVGHEVAPFAERTVVHGGAQSMIFQYDNTPAAVSEAENAFSPAQNWTKADGQNVKALALWFRGVAPVGSFSYDAAKTQYTVGGSGDGVDGDSDGFRFVYKKMTGNGSITVKLENLGHTADWAMAGVMFRETLEAGSPMATCGVRATGQAFLRWRTMAGANPIGTLEVPPFPATIVIPHYLRLTRAGSQFTAEHSSDGKTWELVGEMVSVSMAQQVYVGLAVSAAVADAQGTVNTALFSNVATTGTVDAAGPFQAVQDIGMAGNSPQPLYVVVTDKAGKTAVVTHPAGTNAVVTNTWTEWLISLKDITGVNLASISKLAIGVGYRTGAAASGSGTLYIDDIRLYDARFAPEGLTVGAASGVQVAGDNGTVVSIEGIEAKDLILGTTTFAGAPKYADQPPASADDFNTGSSASSDDQAYMQTVFAQPVSKIYLLEKGANDSGYIQAIGANGTPAGGRVAFTAGTFFKSVNKFGGQTGGVIVIAAETPIYGIRILPPDTGALGVDAVCIAGVPAQ